ncbi:MAG: T9SS type A sorting domain-containing protein [Flavobacteriaceae bacterium]|nr:T9SS type A sorting domain-containing protein [Flavobacteriaceae bacterium]
MRKNLFILGVLISVPFYAQVLESDDYESYTLGNVGTQGNHTLTSGTASNYQIIEKDTEHGKSLQVTGSGEAYNTRRTIYKSGLKEAWDAREQGNDILTVSIDFYTGSSSSQREAGSVILESGSNNVIAGILFNNSSGTLIVITPEDTHLSNSNFPTVPKNTWITLAYTYNNNTGEIKYYLEGDRFYTFPTSQQQATNNLVPLRHEIRNTPPYQSGYNSSELTAVVDNYKIEARAYNLGTEDLVSPNTSATTIYPNPVKDIFSVKLSDKFGDSNVKVTITDFSGKIVKQFTANAESYDISELTTGVYLVTFDNGTVKETKKLIKQ